MGVEIKEVESKKDRKEFVNLPFRIYKANKFWVPPIKKEEEKALLPEHNPAFNFCDSKFWIALKDGNCVGRIAGIINKKHNEKTGEKLARFSRTEFIDDAEVVEKLISTVEKWAKEKGMDEVHGPLGFSNLDHQGLLIEGFDHLPSIASEYHLPYYKKHLQSLGYEKEMDWLEFRLKIGDEIPAKAKKLNKVIQKRKGLNVVHFKTKGEMKPYAEKIFSLLNEAFGDLFSVVEFDKEMKQYYIDRYFNLLNPKFVKVVENKEGNVVGFIIGLPSLSRAMQKTKGKLFPFGFIHIMKALKKPVEVDLLLTAIDPEMQGQGVSALLITELQQVMIDHGVTDVETTGIIETNQKAIQHWKNYEHIQHKRKRCFRKKLA